MRDVSPHGAARHDNKMNYTDVILLSLVIGVVAFLYSSVGHAGASGYIAVMALWGLSPSEIRPTALVLNILVASIGAYQFWSAGHFSWKLFWPFALLAVPRPISVVICSCLSRS